MRYPKPYYDACKLQDNIMQLAEAKPLREMANLAKSYATLEVLKLRIRMKPAPKAVDVQKQVKTKAKPVLPSED
jgi:hypothetical protein